jgi:hypothetical protein
MCNQLKEKFDEWREWLLGDDIHSIRHQIHNMIWDSAVFQSINEARGYAPQDEAGQIEVNRMVHLFINRSFFETQAVAIRRLLDEGAFSGPKSVYSLYGLLDNMERNSGLLTRKAILCALDLPYDYVNRKAELDQGWNGSLRKAGKEHQKCGMSETIHRYLDSLTGIDASRRSPNDLVRPSFFRWLKADLVRHKAIRAFVDKFLAHSATPESRATLADGETDILLEQIHDAHKTIWRITDLIGTCLFGAGLGVTLTTTFDQFEHFDKPWATKETIAKLQESWNEYRATTRKWNEWKWEAEYASSRSGPNH